MSAAEKLLPIHAEVGNRIKQRRKHLDISQTKLADIMGSSYQQIQKYESGANQLTLGKLLQFARALNVDPAYFYEGIPILDHAEEEHSGDVIGKGTHKRLQILLVEDSPADALLFAKASEPFDSHIHLHCLSDAEQVMEFLARQAASAESTIDLIILDLSLPKINGLQLLKTIKGNSQTATTPCVVLTNSISRREMLEAYRLGAAGFMQKSLHLTEYRHSVESMIRYWLEVVALPCD